jgi:hypothetical protein
LDVAKQGFAPVGFKYEIRGRGTLRRQRIGPLEWQVFFRARNRILRVRHAGAMEGGHRARKSQPIVSIIREQISGLTGTKYPRKHQDPD